MTVLCVVGPTASGKTKMAVALARWLNGEVVSVDSMQIYRGMTIGTAAAELRKTAPATVEQAASITASALLRGARGNSGVILSLLFRGISKGLKGHESAAPAAFAAALQEGVSSAYKAVMKPTEGTILTVSRLAAKRAVEAAAEGEGLEGVLAAAIAEGRIALEQTIDMNPVLKKAGWWTPAARASS